MRPEQRRPKVTVVGYEGSIATVHQTIAGGTRTPSLPGNVFVIFIRAPRAKWLVGYALEVEESRVRPIARP